LKFAAKEAINNTGDVSLRSPTQAAPPASLPPFRPAAAAGAAAWPVAEKNRNAEVEEWSERMNDGG